MKPLREEYREKLQYNCDYSVVEELNYRLSVLETLAFYSEESKKMQTTEGFKVHFKALSNYCIHTANEKPCYEKPYAVQAFKSCVSHLNTAYKETAYAIKDEQVANYSQLVSRFISCMITTWIVYREQIIKCH